MAFRSPGSAIIVTLAWWLVWLHGVNSRSSSRYEPDKNDRFGQPGKRVILPEGPWVQTAADVDLRGNRLCAKMRKPDGHWAPRDCINVQYGQTFENDAGRFRLITSEQFPLGSWAETARNIRREGNLLYAEVRREDLSYATVTALIGESTFFQNRDGVLFRMRAACPAMGSCLLSFFMKDGAEFIMCEDIVCDPYLDLSTCCDVAMPCSNLTTCVFPQVPDPEAYCDGPVCVPERDEDLCCVGAAKCDSLGECIYGFSLRRGASEIECASNRCHPEDEADLCCDRSARCSTMEVDCPPGYFFNELDFCLGTECITWRDRHVCCQTAEKCNGFDCPHGMWGMYNASEIWCDGPVCVPERDTDICCDPAESCLSDAIECPFGRIALNNTYCRGTTCVPERGDLAHCCRFAERCNGLDHYMCSLGYNFNFSDYCEGEWCDEERDREVCCQKAEPCSTLVCPFSYLAKLLEYVWAPLLPYAPDAVEPILDERPGPPPGGFPADVVVTTTTPPAIRGGYVESLYCAGIVCNLERDRDICCDVQAICTEITCPLGYVHAWNVATRLCLGPECVVERDRDVCCEVAGNCTEAYECPHAYVAKPVAFCDGTECEAARDLVHCCDDAMPCIQNLTCKTNFILKPDRYCSKAIHDPMPCSLEVDHDECCQRGMVLQYFRFTPTKVRGDRNYMIQISEFRLWFYGAIVEGSNAEQGALAYSVDGRYPVNEGPDKAIDQSLGTKWLDEDPNPNRPDRDFVFQGLTIKLFAGKPIDSYSFVTGDDSPGRDPVSWVFEASPDDVQYVAMSTVVGNFDEVTEERKAESLRYPVYVPCFSPLSRDIEHATTPYTCAEGDILSSGQLCTPQCKPGFTPSYASLNCTDGKLEPWIFECLPS